MDPISFMAGFLFGVVLPGLIVGGILAWLGFKLLQWMGK